ncbi:MAG: metallophosphatase family protein [Paludibacteraceae bacterium]|nr:metallophosphatase family protein [Paludibacteraceae bacterium]
MKRIILLSDTHGLFDDAIERHIDGCDEIWHAGDIGSLSVVNRLSQFAPLRAVHGNIDDAVIRHQFPQFQLFSCEGVAVMMTHIGGYPGKYSHEAYNKITNSGFLNLPAKVKLFVCGHSHILRVIYDKHFDFLTLNPGAVGVEGFHQVRTLLKFSLDDGNISDLDVVNIPRVFKT